MICSTVFKVFRVGWGTYSFDLHVGVKLRYGLFFKDYVFKMRYMNTIFCANNSIVCLDSYMFAWI